MGASLWIILNISLWCPLSFLCEKLCNSFSVAGLSPRFSQTALCAPLKSGSEESTESTEVDAGGLPTLADGASAD